MRPLVSSLTVVVAAYLAVIGAASGAEVPKEPTNSVPLRLSAAEALETYQRSVNELLESKILPGLRLASGTMSYRPDADVLIRVSGAADPRAFDFISLPGGATAAEFSAGYVALLDFGIEASLIAPKLGLEQENEDYATYLQRLTVARESVLTGAREQQRALAFYEFAVIDKRVRDELLAEKTFRKQRSTLLQTGIAWTSAHLYAHQLLKFTDVPATEEQNERRIDDLTLELLKRGKLLRIPDVTSLLLFATAEAEGDRPDYTLTHCRAVRLTLAAVESVVAPSDATPAQRAQYDAQHARAVTQLQESQRRRCAADQR